MKVINYRPPYKNSPEAVIALFDVYIGQHDLTLSEFKVIMKKKGGWFVAFPTFSKETSEGKDFYPYFSFGKEKREEFDKKVRILLEPLVQIKDSNGN
jgi:hypothetical protein